MGGRSPIAAGRSWLPAPGKCRRAAGGNGGTPSYAGGVITAVDRTITANDESDGSSEQLTGLLETDAAIVSGDSGGPLVNTDGEGFEVSLNYMIRLEEADFENPEQLKKLAEESSMAEQGAQLLQ